MFGRKKQEEEWLIGDEDFFDEVYNAECSASTDNSLKKRKRVKQPANILISEQDTPKARCNLRFIIPTAVFLIFVLAFIGYINTDFDEQGNPYIVTMELHYERKYVKEADKLLNLMIEINETIDNDTRLLPSQYISISSELSDEMNQLKSKTTTFSKYVGVPEKFNSYHAQLINFSLSTQELIDKLLKNYNDENYESFREAAINDYYQAFGKIRQARTEIDNIIFRNMEGK